MEWKAALGSCGIGGADDRNCDDCASGGGR